MDGTQDATKNSDADDDEAEESVGRTDFRRKFELKKRFSLRAKQGRKRIAYVLEPI